MSVKLYDERNVDFYNPKPYLTELIGLLDEKSVAKIAWYLDNVKHDYLFEWPENYEGDKESWSSKKNRVLKKNALELLKPEHFDDFVSAFFNELDALGRNIDDRIEILKSKIHELNGQILQTENMKQAFIESKKEQENLLKKYEEIVIKYARPESNT